MPILIKGSGGKLVKFVTITVSEAAGNRLSFFYYNGYGALILTSVSNNGTLKVPKNAMCRVSPRQVNTSYRFTIATGSEAGEIFDPSDDPNFCFFVPYNDCTLSYG